MTNVRSTWHSLPSLSKKPKCGTRANYDRGCRCELCRNANSEYTLEKRLQKKRKDARYE